jgi:hypothetical protein
MWWCELTGFLCTVCICTTALKSKRKNGADKSCWQSGRRTCASCESGEDKKIPKKGCPNSGNNTSNDARVCSAQTTRQQDGQKGHLDRQLLQQEWSPTWSSSDRPYTENTRRTILYTQMHGQGLPQECHHSLATGLLRGTCSTTPEPLCFGLRGAPGALSGAFPVQERLLLLAPSTTRFASSHPLRNKRRVGRGMGRRALWGPRSSTLIRGQGACERGLRDAHALLCRACAQIASPDELELGPSPAARGPAADLLQQDGRL